MKNENESKISAYLRLAELCGIGDESKKKYYMMQVENLLNGNSTSSIKTMNRCDFVSYLIRNYPFQGDYPYLNDDKSTQEWILVMIEFLKNKMNAKYLCEQSYCSGKCYGDYKNHLSCKRCPYKSKIDIHDTSYFQEIMWDVFWDKYTWFPEDEYGQWKHGEGMKDYSKIVDDCLTWIGGIDEL